jgi:hypothetical protein
VLPSLLSRPVETKCRPISKNIASDPRTSTAPLFFSQLFGANNILAGGPGGIRTLVQNAFALKGLQQFFTYKSVSKIVEQLVLLQLRDTLSYYLSRLNVASLLSFLTHSYFKPYTLSFL